MSFLTNKTIGVVALAGECDIELVKQAKVNLENLGFNIILSKNIYDNDLYLAGSDADKVSELTKFFLDKNIDIILCARGGYGSIRLIKQIDYNIIQKNNKPFCGFSDITALLLMIYKKTGIITYHSPMFCSDFSKNILPYTYNHFCMAMSGDELQFSGTKIYKNGNVKGIIWGGNLSTIVSLCGQDFIPNEDFIFFAEDLNEQVYKIDKMFQQLLNIDNFFQHCKGIILGDFLNTDNPIWLEEYFTRLAQRYSMPIIGGYAITHNDNKITIPIGRKAILENEKLTILRSNV